ncbi:lipid-A-disaccharide synthase [Niveibacterium sp. SC-1]|uniref:lipid-A-disaccharide synthase n=1 Tax=Niveibacterium sp. SC-1 TaxID=3135646 RepID=UPI00311E7DC7
MVTRIALVAGEASGDLLGASLIAALRERLPDARFVGIGGPKMQREGFESWFPAERLAVMGFVDVLRRLPELLRIRRELIRRVLAEDVDLFIGIDAPDFNLGVEKRLKRRGVKTIHYVSPSIWAWRGSRAKKIKASASHVLCLFPCEPELYAKHEMPATFIGHPLADEFPLKPDVLAARERLAIPGDARVVVLMPGSRKGEVSRLAADFIGAAGLMAQRAPDLRFLVPLVTRETYELFRDALYAAQLPAEFPLRIMFGHSHDAMVAADAVLLASGTAALESALLKRPTVVAYRVGKWTHRLLKRLMYLPYVSLPNILCRDFVIPELLQDQCTPEKLADAVCAWLADADARKVLQERFVSLHEELRRGSASRAAQVVIEQLGRAA